MRVHLRVTLVMDPAMLVMTLSMLNSQKPSNLIFGF
jgi:hypothetical protein